MCSGSQLKALWLPADSDSYLRTKSQSLKREADTASTFLPSSALQVEKPNGDGSLKCRLLTVKNYTLDEDT